MKSKPQYITNDKGKKVAVILSMKEYYKITEDLEMVEDVKLYDYAKKSKEPSVPIEIAFKEIEAKRKKKK
jgi:hypothetical protein